MTESSPAQCKYSYEPPNDLVIDDDVGLPEIEYSGCPHESIDSEESRCLFHLTETEYPSERFTDRFRETLTDETVAPTFAGGNLETIDLAGETVTTHSGAPIDLRGTLIDGDLILTGATIEVPLLLNRAAITGSLEADDATFQSIVSVAGADIDGWMSFHSATIEGPLVGTAMNAGYVDARDLTVNDGLYFPGTSFASNLLMARATINDDLLLTDATFNWSIDATNLSVAGDFVATDVSIDAGLDCIAADIDGDVELRNLDVGEDTDWSHAAISGGLTATDASFSDEVSFKDVSVGGDSLRFDGAHFAGKADFGTLRVPDGSISYTEATFEDEVWFTHAAINGMSDFSQAKFSGMAHLRDASFEENLKLRSAEATGQFFLHGSTIAGEYDCTDASFEHFQFSATVEGKADFSNAEFLEKGIFKSSTFEDRVWFNGVSFAGHPDFSDTRFTGKVTFDEAEFLVDPTFEDTRFAVDPDLSAANYPLAEDIDLADRRERMILAHPDTLKREGESFPVDTLSGEFSIPAATTHLVDNDPVLTKGISKSLNEFESPDWDNTVEEPLRTARTAVARLSNQDEATLVFGLNLQPEGPPSIDWIEEVMLAGVYTQEDEDIVFGHLNTGFIEADYLVPIPASDDAFDSGAAVATSTELHKAALRNEMYRAALLSEQEDKSQMIHKPLIPLLVGAGKQE